MKRTTFIAWDAIELHREFSGRQLAIIIIFAEAQRRRTKVKRSGIRVPICGLSTPTYGAVHHVEAPSG